MDDLWIWFVLPIVGWLVGSMIGHLIVGDVQVPRIPVVSPAWEVLRWRVTQPVVDAIERLINATSSGVDKLSGKLTKR